MDEHDLKFTMQQICNHQVLGFLCKVTGNKNIEECTLFHFEQELYSFITSH